MWTSFTPLLRSACLALSAFGTLGACSDRYDALAPMTAQPKTPAGRNITSFTPALQCMDTLLARSGRPSLQISATQIPDRTRSISVGAEDMLINAISQMNRRSKAYVFVDQGVVRSSSGALLRIEYDNMKDEPAPAKPTYYISGSISQVDANVRDTGVTTNYNPSEVYPYSRRMGPSDRSTSRSNSVVTVDLHLVAYPSRQVVPGASVSNSMVVTTKMLGANLTGLITQSTLGLKIKVQRLESRGQAVRNLLELGVIELLGQHARVPYWNCLSLESTDARANARLEQAHVTRPEGEQLREAQTLLTRMGRRTEPVTGRADASTRQALSTFQAEQRLVAHGKPDFDTVNALREAAPVIRAPARKPASTAPAKTPAAASPPAAPEEYRSITSFLD